MSKESELFSDWSDKLELYKREAVAYFKEYNWINKQKRRKEEGQKRHAKVKPISHNGYITLPWTEESKFLQGQIQL